MPLTATDRPPVAEPADEAVLDTNNDMAWRDGRIPAIDPGEKTEHELRQEQLSRSGVAQAFTHIQAPVVLTADRPALSVSSDSPDAVAPVNRLYEQFGFETVDDTLLSESWRTAPGRPAWNHHDHQKRAGLARNLRNARFVAHARPWSRAPAPAPHHREEDS